MTVIDGLRAEHYERARGIGEARPRLSWRLQAASEASVQTAYEIEVRRGAENAQRRFQSGLIEGSDSLLVPWPVSPLESRELVEVRVRVWLDGSTTASDWSGILQIEAGLLDVTDWQADFVSPSLSAGESGTRPAHLLRAGFDVRDVHTVARARVYATAHGVYDVVVNGADVTDDILSPGWSSYSHRLRYQTLDITPYLTEGSNVVGAWLADGWWRGKLGFNGGRWNNYGHDVALLLQLELTRLDGTVEIADLQKSWKYAASAITSTGLYEGEVHDARLATNQWAVVGFDAGDWLSPATIARAASSAELVAPTGPPVRIVETLRPLSIERVPGNRIRLDFGQNIAGKLRITVTGPRGQNVVLRHAEVLEDGELSTRPLRGAPSVDHYILAGLGTSETWTPRFTLHGFRYAELENWPGEFDPDAVVALVVHSDMVRTGYFDSSNPMLNKLHENVVWSMRDNFVDLPTDCPQRDERLGWTGDIQVFGPTAAFLYQSTGTLIGWLRDVAAEQKHCGSVPNFVPWIECGFPAEPAAAWGDVAVVLPWTLYERTGDAKILADQYESMCAWVEQIDVLTDHTGLWNEGFQLGDWLDPAAPPERPDESHTDRYLVATAYHAYSAGLLSKTASVLGRADDARRYLQIAERAKAAFRAEFVTANGRVVSDTETALALAIMFDLLLDDAQISRAGERLVELVEEGGYTIRTGFVGTPIICDALARVGAFDTVYHLLLQTECPSWLYPVTMGATTVWERWDSMLPDGTINPGEMTSFNHYSLGAVADYLHRVVAGLAPAAPGYRSLLIEPHPGGSLTQASAELMTPFGRASSSWTRSGTDFILRVGVPVGTSAQILMPDASDSVHVGPGTHEFRCTVRAAADDPQPMRRANTHNPDENLTDIEESDLLQLLQT